MRYKVTLFFNFQHIAQIASKTIAGLGILESQEFIGFRMAQGTAPYAQSNVTLILNVKCLESNQRRLIALDLRDRSDVLTPEALTHCDIYFKRSYYEPDLHAVSAQERSKIVPFGLNFSCTTPQSKKQIAAALTQRYFQICLRSPGKIRAHTSHFLHQLRIYMLLADESLMQYPPEAAAEPKIVYQPRLYRPEDKIENWDAINSERAELVHALRDAFGEQFQGGLEPNEYAKERYPDLTSSHPTRHAEHLLSTRGALIGIYTRGLHHSLAFKLPEYLASAKCIVSEPLRHQLPIPLRPEENYLEFITPDECVAQCQRLLNNEALAFNMRKRNFAYYQQEVSPAAHLKNCIKRAFAKGL